VWWVGGWGLFEIATREENTSEGELSARWISLLQEVKEIIEGRRDPATNSTINGDEASARKLRPRNFRPLEK